MNKNIDIIETFKINTSIDNCVYILDPMIILFIIILLILIFYIASLKDLDK